ncbi:hypothetical protein [Pseudomonas borbori]|uniref:Uncharacterized protein n=1 Tax=Pseudomonas borbori TaxID=289003 RepID=A0A1I5RPP6_9PSED|nr:hypothetical protein [Pseudomonas borbori]SFP60221.1 hypothetical protein SAMN05216190_113136 [Pseudomonas borbori]
MNDDVMRIPDLVKECARYYEVDDQEAAHTLHELIKELSLEYSVRQGKVALPSHIFWVGRVDGPQQSIRTYKLFFEGLVEYLDLLSDPLSSVEKYSIRSYCESDSSAKNIPVNLIYLSRIALGEWALNAGIEPPTYILEGSSAKRAKKNEEEPTLKENELATVSRITNGLFDLIKAIDKSHSEVPLTKQDKDRLREIKRGLALLNNPPRTNFDRYSTVILLAKDAGVEMRCDPKTLRRYMRPKSNDND